MKKEKRIEMRPARNRCSETRKALTLGTVKTWTPNETIEFSGSLSVRRYDSATLA